MYVGFGTNHGFRHPLGVLAPIPEDRGNCCTCLDPPTRAGTVGRGDYRNYYTGHMNKSQGEGGEGGGKWVHLGWGEGMGRKGIQL